MTDQTKPTGVQRVSAETAIGIIRAAHVHAKAMRLVRRLIVLGFPTDVGACSLTDAGPLGYWLNGPQADRDYWLSIAETDLPPSVASDLALGRRPMGGELQADDVGRPLDPLDGFGLVLEDDIGKRVWLKRHGFTMENADQRDARKDTGPRCRPAPRPSTKRTYGSVTKAQALADFMRDVARPHIAARRAEGRRVDSVMLNEAWSAYTDGLCKDGSISLWQYENWHAPSFKR